MATRFYGRFEHALDAKGRVILPSRFRTQIDASTAFLSQYEEGCVALWTEAEFDKQAEAQERKQYLGREERNAARMFSSGSAEVEIDKQGRIAIPAFLREFAHLELESPILLTGNLNRVELWNPTLWELRIKPSERKLTEGLDDPFAAAPSSAAPAPSPASTAPPSPANQSSPPEAS